MKKAAQKFRKYFIPREENGYKPHFLRPRSIAFLCMILVVGEITFLIAPSYLVSRSRLFGVVLTNALVEETNQSRVAQNLPTLAENPLLDAAAKEKAEDMVQNNYFAHTSPAGITPWYWFANVGYDFEYAGENLAVNFSDSQDVTTAWMNSPEHRANILNANYTDIGMAIATGTYEGQAAVYVVELFGTPATAPIAFINTAAAAMTPVVSVPSPVVQPTTKTRVAPPVKPVKPVAEVPVVIASSASANAVSQESFVAVKGASTGTAAVALAQPAPQAAGSVSAVTPVAPVVAAPVSANNPVQQAASSPRQLMNDLYLLIIAILFVALLLDIFIKIRIQHPQLIFGGVSVIAVAALFIVLNQHLLITHGVIF